MQSPYDNKERNHQHYNKIVCQMLYCAYYVVYNRGEPLYLSVCNSGICTGKQNKPYEKPLSGTAKISRWSK